MDNNNSLESFDDFIENERERCNKNDDLENVMNYLHATCPEQVDFHIGKRVEELCICPGAPDWKTYNQTQTHHQLPAAYK